MPELAGGSSSNCVAPSRLFEDAAPPDHGTDSDRLSIPSAAMVGALDNNETNNKPVKQPPVTRRAIFGSCMGTNGIGGGVITSISSRSTFCFGEPIQLAGRGWRPVLPSASHLAGLGQSLSGQTVGWIELDRPLNMMDGAVAFVLL